MRNNILFSVLFIFAFSAFSQDLILAPLDQSIVFVNKKLSTIDVLLNVKDEIDSTHYIVEHIEINNKTTKQEYWSIKNPYTAEIPVVYGQKSIITITSYYKGKKRITETSEVFFKRDLKGIYVFD